MKTKYQTKAAVKGRESPDCHVPATYIGRQDHGSQVNSISQLAQTARLDDSWAPPAGRQRIALDILQTCASRGARRRHTSPHKIGVPNSTSKNQNDDKLRHPTPPPPNPPRPKNQPVPNSSNLIIEAFLR